MLPSDIRDELYVVLERAFILLVFTYFSFASYQAYST